MGEREAEKGETVGTGEQRNQERGMRGKERKEMEILKKDPYAPN